MELVERARRLEEPAWAEIYRRHAQQVYAYIYYRLGDQHTAEDLASDVFVKALAGIKGYAWRGTPLLAWLYRIAHNVTVDHRKSAARRMQHQAPGDADAAEDRVDRLGELDARADMMSAIRALTEDQQQVVILRFYQGLSNAEVSSVLGKPEGAVKALQSRALRSLRRHLEAQASELETA
jgi:RNA polymerase sigma-70 factor (ECF subfamily)